MDAKDREIGRLRDEVAELCATCWCREALVADMRQQLCVARRALRWHPLKRLRLWLWERKR